LWCSGENSYGQRGIEVEPREEERGRDGFEPVGAEKRWKSLATSGNYNCALASKDNSLWCWGSFQLGRVKWRCDDCAPLPLGKDRDWAQVSVASTHGCGLKQDHSLWCWGDNTSGEVGDGTTEPRKAPVRLAGPQKWIAVATGQGFTCAIAQEGTLWCWGSNHAGQLGQEEPQRPLQPVASSRKGPWRDLVASGSGEHLCGQRDDNSLWCWGGNSHGQIGSAPLQRTPRRIWYEDTLPRWPVAAGRSKTAYIKEDLPGHWCYIDQEKNLWCWGDNDFGQLGDGTTLDRDWPRQVEPHRRWQAISLGIDYSCAIDVAGHLWCWGNNARGQLGDGTTTDKPVSVPIAESNTWQSISTGAGTCGIDTSGELWCWGYMAQELNGGWGDFYRQMKPLKIEGDTRWQAIKNNNVERFVGLDTAGHLRSWSEIDSTAFAHLEYMPGLLDKRWKTLPNENGVFCGLDQFSEAWCYAYPSKNQELCLGRARDPNDKLPVKVKANVHWQALKIVDNRLCGIDLGGKLWCCQDERFHLLKEAKETEQSQFDRALLWQGEMWRISHQADEKIKELKRLQWFAQWQAISVGESHACGIEQRGKGWCWGGNMDGQLGHGTFKSSPTPGRIEGEHQWRTLACGATSTCGLDVNGGLWCWGGNRNKIKVNSTPQRILPNLQWQDLWFKDARFWALDLSKKLWSCDAEQPLPHRFAEDKSQNPWAKEGPLRPEVLDKTWPSYWQQRQWKALAKSDYACGIETQGRLSCWGNYFSSTIDPASRGESLTPDPVRFWTKWKRYAEGGRHQCAIDEEQHLWCWGKNKRGQLGTGVKFEPLRLMHERTWLEVAAGETHSCAIDATNKLWCTGDNQQGQLGINAKDKPYQDQFSAVSSSQSFTRLAAGEAHTCAIDAQGKLWCWGQNTWGQCGDGQRENRYLPTEIKPQRKWTMVSAAGHMSCAIDQEQMLWCWGDNRLGQLGDGTTIIRYQPTLISESRDWESVDVHQHYTCATKKNQTHWCWGKDLVRITAVITAGPHPLQLNHPQP
jgi:alpha-tubulin suppressor-like RCC1 family protein